MNTYHHKDVREDGYIFWSYKTITNKRTGLKEKKESWISPESFVKAKKKQTETARKRRSKWTPEQRELARLRNIRYNQSTKGKETTQKYRASGRSKNSRLSSTYGISLQEYSTIKITQNNSCNVCGTTFEGLEDRFIHLDHNHDTGQIRSILCHHCNLLIGLSRETPNILIRAAEYLSDYKKD
jgi:hypothetical protein